MLIAQKWFEKRDRILIMVPLPLLRQWQEVMEKHFTFPFAVAGDTLPDGVVLATYEWTAAHAAELAAIHWDLVLIMTPEYGGGEIWFDDVLIRKDGRFLLPELECLNPENLK